MQNLPGRDYDQGLRSILKPTHSDVDVESVKPNIFLSLSDRFPARNSESYAC